MRFGMGRRATVRLSLLGGAAAVGIAIGAQFATAEQEKVVARVDGAPITERSLQFAEADIGQAMAGLPPPAKQEFLTSFMVDLRVLAQAAEKEGIAESEGFKERLAYLRDKALMEEFLEREAEKAVSSEAVRKLYDEQIAAAPKETEVHARHILVETEEEANAIIAELNKGADFAEVAKQKTKDPSGAESGGDLGFFTKDQMVPEFAEAAFALEPGRISEKPVKSQFGWHVIKVEEKRERQPPAFEEVEDRIQAYLTRKAQADLVTRLRSEAKIEKTSAPAPTAGTEPAPSESPAQAAPQQPTQPAQ